MFFQYFLVYMGCDTDQIYTNKNLFYVVKIYQYFILLLNKSQKFPNICLKLKNIILAAMNIYILRI